jgi:hypothetical protein
MVDDKPIREEDNKVVMSKLPRDEFANFKKLCDRENKTINKKIRELVNQHISEHFGLSIELKGEKKKFFIPAENKFLEVIEVHNLKNEMLSKMKKDKEKFYERLDLKKGKWSFEVKTGDKNVRQR